MAGILNRAVTKSGATAYQDHVDPKKFHYMPNRIDTVIGQTLQSFECKYYGIGEKPYYVKTGSKIRDVSGGTVSGQAVPDITEEQHASLLKEIGKVYKIDDAYLSPLTVEKAKIQPVFAGAVAAAGEGSSSTFPDTFQFGSSFNFNISSGNSLFPQLVAVSNVGQEADVSSFIAANFQGIAKLYGDPWTARITADLSEIWSYVRNKGEAGVSAGWLNFGAAWDKVAQELVKNNIVKIEYREGTGGEEFGRNLLESTRKLFDAINAQITAGEGMFKFPPNPDPQQPPEGSKSWGSSLLPFSVSANLSFSSNSFKKEIKFDQEISFTGIREIPVVSSMNLSAVCGSKTKGMFLDVGDAKNKCVDANTMDGWQRRMSAETKLKSKKTQEYEQMFISNKITFEQYQQLLAFLDTQTLSEAADARGNPISEARAIAAHDEVVSKFILNRR